ncbi:MAG: glycine cleavage system protein GcvH [Marinibacterium sp.]
MATYYSEEHEWIDVEDDIATLGITAHASEQLGDIVFVEQKDEGDSFAKGDEIGVIESVKAASEIYAPVDGEVIEVNQALADAPEMLNDDPEGDAWIYKIRVIDPSQLSDLMNRDGYAKMIG